MQNAKIKMIMRNVKIKNQGFSLIESVTAIFIVSMALVSVLAVAQTTIRAQTVNKNAIIASMLAQEGLELVRNIRDTNWRQGNPWANNILQDGDYTIDYTGAINSTPDNIDDAGTELYRNASGYYVHSVTANPTPFRRLIKVVNNGNYLEVTCLVKAQIPGNNTYTYQASTLLYDWW